MEEERKIDGGGGSGGLSPEKCLRSTPSRTSDIALVEHRVKVAKEQNLTPVR